MTDAPPTNELPSFAHVMLRQTNAPLVVSALVIYALAGATAWFLSKRRPRLVERVNSAERGWVLALAVLAAVYFLGYTWLSLHCYRKLMCGAWDLGIFDSLFNNALHGRFFRDFRGPFDHFQPIYLLFVPFYALWRDARLLLVLQSLLFAAAAVPLYLLGKEVAGRKSVGALLGIMYLLYPMIGEANLCDFHMLSASPLCFFTMLLFMVRRKWLWYWVFLALTLCVRESESIIVFGAGLYLVSRREYRRGFATAAVAVIWFFAATKVFLPAATGVAFRHLGRFAGLGETAGWAVSTELGRLSAAAYAVRVLAVCLAALVPLGALFAWRWRPFVLVFAPAFTVNMAARSIFQNTLYGHYAITAASAAIGASALAAGALGRLSDGKKPSVAPLFLLIVAVLSNIVLSYPAHQKGLYPKAHLQMENSWNVMGFPLPVTPERRDFYRTTPHEKLFFYIKDAFPDGARILSQNNLAFAFVNRCSPRVIGLEEEVASEFYLFDTGVNIGRIPPRTYQEYFERLDGDPTLVKFLDTRRPYVGGFVFYARGNRWQEVYRKAVEFVSLHPEAPASALK